MFGSLGGGEIILIFIVALIVFGPKRLPEIGRTVGGWVQQFRKATGEFRSNVEREIGFDPMTGLETTKKVRRDLLSAVSGPIREVAEETRRTVRQARDESAALGKAGALDPEVIPPDHRTVEQDSASSIRSRKAEGRGSNDEGGPGE